MKQKYEKYLLGEVKKGELVQRSPQEFDKALKKFIDGAQKRINDYTKRFLENLNPDMLSYKEGPKFIKIFRHRGFPKASGEKYEKKGGSVWGFIDKGTGDVLKAASFRAPAKHARGNLFDDNGGLGAVTVHGSVAYLR